MVYTCRILLSLSVLCLISLSSSFILNSSEQNVYNISDIDNYIVNGDLSDGEHEVWMRFGDIIVRETSTVDSNSDNHKKGGGLLLRQMASGPDFLQMVFKVRKGKGKKLSRRDKLVECEVINDWGAADQFRSQFQQELNRSGLKLGVPVNSSAEPLDPAANEFSDAKSIGDPIDIHKSVDVFQNVTVRELKNDEVVGDLQNSFDLIHHQRLCRRLHRKEQRLAAKNVNVPTSDENESSNKPARGSGFLFNWEFGRVPGTKWCGVGTAADKFTTLGAHVGADRCCRAHDGCPYQIPGFTSKYGLFNYRVHTTVSHCACDDRYKREIGDAFRLPGTRWCGRGYSAKDVTDLGGFTGADKCCRNHDLSCPYFIEGFTEKYGVFNWRPYTANNCACDDRFRSCLKMTNTGAANFVGKVFFNVVQTKCFELKAEKTCIKSSWWGKCQKYGYKKQAYLRDPVPY